MYVQEYSLGKNAFQHEKFCLSKTLVQTILDGVIPSNCKNSLKTVTKHLFC